MRVDRPVLERDSGNDLVAFALGKFAAAHLLPDDVAEFRDDEIRDMESVFCLEKQCRFSLKDFRNIPLFGDTRVDNIVHLARSSLSRTALSVNLCDRPRRLRLMR